MTAVVDSTTNGVTAGEYSVTFPVDDKDMSMGELKAEAKQLVAAAADGYGLRRTSPVQVEISHGEHPLVQAKVAVQWAGSQPVIRGWL